MKNKIAALLIFFTVPFYSQTIFSQFDGVEGINAIVVNKKMFDLMTKVKLDTSDKNTAQYMNLIKKLDNLEVYNTKNEQVVLKMRLTVERYAKSMGLQELVKTNQNGKKTSVLVKSNETKTQLKEMVLFVESKENEDSLLMAVTGDFNLNEMTVLTDKMNISAGEELKQLSR